MSHVDNRGDVAGRAFQTEGIANAKFLTQKHDWPVRCKQIEQEEQKKQMRSKRSWWMIYEGGGKSGASAGRWTS